MIVTVVVQPAAVLVPVVGPAPQWAATNASVLRGLLDTGASGTCITRSAARAMGLRPRGKSRVGGIGGTNIHNSYRFALGVPYDDGTERGYYWFDEVVAVDFEDNSDFEVLICCCPLNA